jgi:tRNA (cytidine32/guanosine34-2'-O)-methyltransferase
LTSGGKIPIDRLPSFPQPIIKLTDFGLSRFIDLEKPLLQTRCGSESFAAPEIVMGQPYDGRMTDSWACGVTLYALLTGELPFDRLLPSYLTVDGESETERRRRMMRIAKGQYGWPSGSQSREAQAVVASLLQRDPSRRTRVGKALWEEHPWMSGSGGVPAPTESVADDGEVVGRFGRRVLDGWLLDHGEGSVAREETM